MKVAIAGYGLEGKTSLAYWRDLGADVVVLDEKDNLEDVPSDVDVITGSDAFSHLEAYDMVVRTASLRPDRLSSAKKIWSATNEFFAKCPAPIIGVTGTKGKGTTCSLITSILRSADYTVHLVGNIGTPALQILPNVRVTDVVVFEMSSFQLWDIEKSPHTAVVLMIEPDHQDIHEGMDEYIQAKSNIRRFQQAGDACYYHSTNPYSKQIAFSSEISRPRRYGVADDDACYVKENTFFVQDTPICSVSTLQLVGQHNIENACAAVSAAWDYTQNTEAIEAGLCSFDGLPHRTKYIREVSGVRYFDDNYSSAPGATIAAVRSFSSPEIVIVGGYDKHVSFTELAKVVAEQSSIKKVLLIGQTRQALAEAFLKAGVNQDKYEILHDQTLELIVRRAAAIAVEGDVVIMSPGCASFDMFRNFADRGDQFIQVVSQL